MAVMGAHTPPGLSFNPQGAVCHPYPMEYVLRENRQCRVIPSRFAPLHGPSARMPLTLAFCLMVLLAGCGGSEGTASRAPTATPALPTDPLAQMEIAFDGNPTRREIKEGLDRAFAATSTPTTDDNYSRAGSVLVTFKNTNGIKEMDILECIPHRARDPRISEHNFPNVAAVCSTDLVKGDYP